MRHFMKGRALILIAAGAGGACTQQQSQTSSAPAANASAIIIDVAKESSSLPAAQMSETTWDDPNFKGPTTFKGVWLSDLLQNNAPFNNVLSSIKQQPGLSKSYIAKFYTLDGFTPEMELTTLLDCDSTDATVFKEKCADGKITSAFIATSQVDGPEKRAAGSCSFMPVTSRLPTEVCADPAYLVWPRLAPPTERTEYPTPWGLTRIEITLRPSASGKP